MQANYLSGLVYLNRFQYSHATKNLTKALEAARESNDAIKDEIWRELARAKYAQWQEDSTRRKTMIESLKSQIPSPAYQQVVTWW